MYWVLTYVPSINLTEGSLRCTPVTEPGVVLPSLGRWVAGLCPWVGYVGSPLAVRLGRLITRGWVK